MTWQEVRERVEAIRAQADDPEVAHVMEDRLWFEVLSVMAQWDGCEIAAEALKTREIEFPRWCA